MASPGFLGSPTNNQAAIEQKVRIEQALKGSASWFIVVAGLSVINSVLSMTGASIRFIFGLGFTQIVDALAHQVGSAGFTLDLIINGIAVGVLAVFWNFARKGQKWAWMVGMGVYLLDGLILVLFKDFLGVAFHAYALYRMWSGFRLLPVLEQLERSAASGAVSSTL